VLQELIINMVNLVFIDSSLASYRAAEMLLRILPSILEDKSIKDDIVDKYIEVCCCKLYNCFFTAKLILKLFLICVYYIAIY
jgi:hypothetical protein